MVEFLSFAAPKNIFIRTNSIRTIELHRLIGSWNLSLQDGNSNLIEDLSNCNYNLREGSV